MQQYILRRMLLNLFVILLVITLIFLALRAVPGNFAVNQIAQQLTIEDFEEAKRVVEHDLGLDKPLPQQFAEYLGSLLKGDLGDSFQSKRPVLAEIKDRLGPSIELGLLQIIVALAVGVPVGIIAAIRQDSWIDYLLRSLAITLLGIPAFVLAVFLLVGSARYLGDTPINDWFSIHTRYVDFFDDPIENLQIMFAPALVGGLGNSAIIMRFLRSQLLEVLRQDYVRTAWAKGLRERVVVLRHCLKNAFIPVLTVIGLLLGTIVSGNVILETLFFIPGIGLYAVTAIRQFDYPVVQGIVLVVAIALVLVNLLVDIAYAWLDPRIRYS